MLLAARIVVVARGDAVATLEAMLIRRIDDSRWRALVRPAKKLRVGERIRFGKASESDACLLGSLDAEVEAKGDAGEIVSIEHYGASAEGNILFEQFGFTPDHVVAAAHASLTRAR